jgi:hypothetical protein
MSHSAAAVAVAAADVHPTRHDQLTSPTIRLHNDCHSHPLMLLPPSFSCAAFAAAGAIAVQ